MASWHLENCIPIHQAHSRCFGESRRSPCGERGLKHMPMIYHSAFGAAAAPSPSGRHGAAKHCGPRAGPP